MPKPTPTLVAPDGAIEAGCAANAQPVTVKNATTQPVTTTRPVMTEPEAIMPTQAAPAVEDDA